MTIQDLIDQAKSSPYPVAVVDFIGRTYQTASGAVKTITDETPFIDRYGIRSYMHVKVYRFNNIIFKNDFFEKMEEKS